MIRVLIVDDQPILGQGLRMLLAAEPDIEVIGEAADDMMALEMAEKLHPDIALVDGEMQQHRGLRTTAALNARCPDTQVIVLSLYDDAVSRRRAERAGAAIFVSKHVPAEMLSAIRHEGNSRRGPGHGSMQDR